MKKGKEGQVETRGSNYLHKCLCGAHRCIQRDVGLGKREVVMGNYLTAGLLTFDPLAMTVCLRLEPPT